MLHQHHPLRTISFQTQHGLWPPFLLCISTTVCEYTCRTFGRTRSNIGPLPCIHLVRVLATQRPFKRRAIYQCKRTSITHNSVCCIVCSDEGLLGFGLPEDLLSTSALFKLGTANVKAYPSSRKAQGHHRTCPFGSPIMTAHLGQAGSCLTEASNFRVSIDVSPVTVIPAVNGDVLLPNDQWWGRSGCLPSVVHPQGKGMVLSVPVIRALAWFVW
jgi:hypothetical protein